MLPDPSRLPEADRRPVVAVIGAGFSGVMAALHLLRVPDGPAVMLLDRRTPFGRGAAYSTGNPDHLLNVRASNMSAWPDQPRHFVDWLAGLRGEAPRDGMFATRGDYGRYLQGLLAGEAECAAAAGRLMIVPDEVVDAVRHGGGWRIELGVGRQRRVNALVLALGNPPPAEQPCVDRALLESGLYVGDPWSWQGIPLKDVDDAPILLIGSGLTMVDVALACSRTEPGRRLVAISRRGLTPNAHQAGMVSDLPRPPEGLSPTALSRWLRQTARQIGWRAAVDSLRPTTQAVWGGWSHAERQQFLRHARPYWDVHRHRLAPEIARRVSALTESGGLSIRAGRLCALSPSGKGVLCRWKPRGGTVEQEQRFARVINCTGPATDLASLREPLLIRLRDQGHISADALKLGLDCTTDGRLVGTHGRPTAGLFGLGPITRGALWEIVAVPDIRQQAPVVAATLASELAEGREALSYQHP